MSDAVALLLTASLRVTGVMAAAWLITLLLRRRALMPIGWTTAVRLRNPLALRGSHSLSRRTRQFLSSVASSILWS